MAAHKGPDSLRPRCTRSGSSVAAIPVLNFLPEDGAAWWNRLARIGSKTVLQDILGWSLLYSYRELHGKLCINLRCIDHSTRPFNKKLLS
jgi:hypothetical protein